MRLRCLCGGLGNRDRRLHHCALCRERAPRKTTRRAVRPTQCGMRRVGVVRAQFITDRRIPQLNRTERIRRSGERTQQLNRAPSAADGGPDGGVYAGRSGQDVNQRLFLSHAPDGESLIFDVAFVLASDFRR